MNAGSPTLSVQRQLKDDWDNREFIQLISDNVKHIAEFLSQFGKQLDNIRKEHNIHWRRLNMSEKLPQYSLALELSVKSRIAVLNDNITKLERKVEFLEARVSVT